MSLTRNIDSSRVVPVDEMRGDSDEDTALLLRMRREAEQYLLSFGWCRSIADAYFGLGVDRVVAVFLFRIVSGARNIDHWLWVVVGDLPPAYLVTEGNPTPASALEAYVEEMAAWVAAVEEGRSLEEVVPVNVPATPHNALELKKRLAFLKTSLISQQW